MTQTIDKQRVAVEFKYRGEWHERSVTVRTLWLLVRDPECTELETL